MNKHATMAVIFCAVAAAVSCEVYAQIVPATSAAPATATAPATQAAPTPGARGGRGGGRGGGGGGPTARDPKGPGFVKATELADGEIPKPTEDGNFIIGATHTRAPEMARNQDVPKGEIKSVRLSSQDSKIYP